MDRTLANIDPALGRCWHPVAYDVLVLPLTPTAELHTRAGRTTLELRRVASDLVAMAAEGAPR
jgi:hypothetical protein